MFTPYHINNTGLYAYTLQQTLHGRTSQGMLKGLFVSDTLLIEVFSNFSPAMHLQNACHTSGIKWESS